MTSCEGEGGREGRKRGLIFGRRSMTSCEGEGGREGRKMRLIFRRRSIISSKRGGREGGIGSERMQISMRKEGNGEANMEKALGDGIQGGTLRTQEGGREEGREGGREGGREVPVVPP